MDYDDIKDKAHNLGARFAEGPDEVLEEIEELLPEPLRNQVVHFPISAMILGMGVGIFLGLKKGDELLSAGVTMVSAAVAANLNSVLGNLNNDSGDQ